MKNWIKLNLLYLGESKKHHIFRAKRWNKKFEKIVNKPVFNENYKELGNIKEIFGPVKFPYISMDLSSDCEFSLENEIYVKIH